MVCILLGSGFEEIEVIAPCDILRRGGVDVKLAGINSLEVAGAHGITVKADVLMADVDEKDIEMIVVPGGLGGVEAIEASEEALALVRRVYERGGEVAAICAGPRVLGGLGILKGKSAVCYPGMEDQMNCEDMHPEEHAVRFGNVTTGRGPGSAMQFGYKLLEVMKGKETAADISSKMHFNG